MNTPTDMNKPTDTYIDDRTYLTLRDALTRIVEVPPTHDPETKVIRILGEIGGVWPLSVQGDASD